MNKIVSLLFVLSCNLFTFNVGAAPVSQEQLGKNVPPQAIPSKDLEDKVRSNVIFIHDINEKVRVACIGDSITYGSYINEPNDFYPSQLSRKLGDRYDVRNFGVSGATLLKQGNIPYWNSQVFADAIAFNPHITIIALGTNDTNPSNWRYKQQFIADYNAMVYTFKKANGKVFACLPTPRAGEQNVTISNEVIPAIRQVSQFNSIPTIDLYKALSDKDALFPDGLHPNAEGAGIIAQEVCAAISNVKIDIEKFPVKATDWFGYAKYEFTVKDLAYCVVVPKIRASGSPWIWRAEFFGHEPQADLELLAKGWYVVYVPSAAGLYGSPKAVKIWNEAYEYLTYEYNFSSKPVLEGFSRGGLLVYNWAASNPDKVSCIYGDAPVCAIQSWPGGKGKSQGSPGDWQNCLKAYGLTEVQGANYNLNPVDNLKPLADAHIPLLNVCGDSDTIVPIEENTLVLKQRYEALGGHIEVIVKKGCGHHPHSLKNPQPIVDFILKYAK